MSPHRLHYMDMRPEPQQAGPGLRLRASFGVLMALAIAFIFGVLLLVHLVAPAATPRPAAGVYAETSSAAIEDARIEGFRAGMAAALEQGCRPVVLHMPIKVR